MKYKLPDIGLTESQLRFVGGRQRYATTTAVKSIDENKIVTAQYMGKKIFLIDISNGFNIISEIRTNYYPDLMDYYNDKIVCTNFPSMGDKNGGTSIFRIEENKIKHEKDIVLPNIKSHGCRFIDDNNLIITSCGDNTRGLLLMDITTEKYEVFDNFQFYPKDVSLVGDKLFVVTSKSRPNMTKGVQVEDSILYVFNYPSMVKIDEMRFFEQTDAISFSNGYGFITLQTSDELLMFSFIDNKLKHVTNIPGYNFPHGVDYYNDRVIVTNYGDNTIQINNINELINFEI